MKRYLVVTSSTSITITQSTPDPDSAVEVAAAGERQRLQAYLYGASTLVAVTHDVEKTGGSNGSHGEFTECYRVRQTALVTVESNTAEDCRYRADYQSGRLQSGSFGVQDFVEDEQAARQAVVGTEVEEAEPTLAEALEYAASCLGAEEVEYSLGLDSDHLECSYVTEHGVERQRTEADLNAEIARHRQFIKVLADAAKTASYR